MAKKLLPPLPADLIAGLWRGHKIVTLRTKELQVVLLHYGADFLFMKDGEGYLLQHKNVGPGIYSVSLRKLSDEEVR